jgi:hypothetical protein
VCGLAELLYADLENVDSPQNKRNRKEKSGINVPWLEARVTGEAVDARNPSQCMRKKHDSR